MAELERMYISQGKERHGGGDDACLGRNKEARQLLRLDTLYDSHLNLDIIEKWKHKDPNNYSLNNCVVEFF